MHRSPNQKHPHSPWFRTLLPVTVAEYAALASGAGPKSVPPLFGSPLKNSDDTMKVPLLTNPAGAVVSHVNEYSPHGGRCRGLCNEREVQRDEAPRRDGGKVEDQVGVPFRKASELTASARIQRAVLFVIV